MPVLAAAVAMSVVGPAEPPTNQTPQAPVATLSPPDMLQSVLGWTWLVPPGQKPQAHGVPTPLGTLAPQSAVVPPAQPPAAVPAPEATPSQQRVEASPQNAAPARGMPPAEVPQGAPAAPLDARSAEPSKALLSQAAEIPQGPAPSRQLQGPSTDPAKPAQEQADLATPPPAAGTLQQPKAAPSKPTLPPGEQPPRVAEYHWFESEPKDGVAAIGYGHPKRQRGEFLIGFNCKAGSGKVTFVMFEAGSSRSQFAKGQKVAVTLEIGSTKASLTGVIESNEGISFPRASATISADDALFKVMDDDVKVLRVDIDGWSAAAPLFLIKDVMPTFSKACAKKKTKPETSVQARDAAPADPAKPAQEQADLATPPPATGTPQQPKAVPSKPTLPPGEKPPRVAEYHWFESEPRDSVAAIGYGHPKRQRGEFLIGFNCKAGSGKVTFVMFEAGSSRSQFTKGQKVAVTLEIGSSRAPLKGVIESNEGTSFPRASATISADDALFKVMDDDVKVLRVDIDGWSAAAPLFLIKDVMPAFSKTCAKKTKPETSVQTRDAVPVKSGLQ
jgi:phage terminase large subunit-like protein